MPEEEKIEFKQVILDMCPVDWLARASHDLYGKLEAKCGEPPSMEDAFRVGLITGGAYVMDTIGIPHDYKEFTLVVDKDFLDA